MYEYDKCRDYVWGIWQYKVIIVEKLFQSKNHLRGKMIGKTWVKYKNTNKDNISIENFSPLYHAHTPPVIQKT